MFLQWCINPQRSLTFTYFLVTGMICLSGCKVERPQSATGTVFDHSQFQGSCTSCHVADRPSGPVGALSFNHTTNGATGDCATCHQAPVGAGGSWAGGQFPHSPQPANCVSCHSPERPTTSDGWVAYDPAKAFDLTTHGGAMDCATCHVSVTNFRAMVGWAGGNYTHSSTDSTCVTCHARPTAPVNGFDHSVNGQGDCIGCHKQALTNVIAQGASPNNSAWVNTGLTYPTTLVAITAPAAGATDYSATTGVPTWNGTTIQAIAASTSGIPETMNHLSLEVPSATLQNCATCHTGASFGLYLPGSYHPNIASQPKTCVECHGSGILHSTGLATTGTPNGLSGLAGANRTPASPEMDHAAKIWSLTNGTWTRSTGAAYNQDCSVCHTNPGANWAGANFHTSLNTAGKAQPASCLDCHANNRPSGSVPTVPPAALPTSFDHANGAGDCMTCHAAPTVTTGATPPSPALWANGVFHTNAGKQTTCSNCHGSQRPTGTTGWVAVNANAPFDFTNHGNGMDCVTCHSGTTVFNLMSGWQGGKYTHSTAGTLTCITCHTSQLPKAPVSGFDHSISGTGDCIGCHSQALTNVINQGATPTAAAWVGTGQTYPSKAVGSQALSIVETTLISTALSIQSSNQVTSTSQVTASLPLQMLHTSSMIPPGHTVNGSLRCTDCHAGASLAVPAYKGGLFHTNPASGTAWPAQPTSCKDCHQGTLPVGIVGAALHNLDHAAVLTSGAAVGASDCSTCHKQPGVKGSWANGTFHANLGTASPQTCTTCHYSDVKPIQASVKNHMTHASSQVTQDCLVCHASPTSTQMTASGYPTSAIWAGGIYHGKISTQPTSCNDCHSSERPGAATLSPVDSASPTRQYMSHTSTWANKDCATCHKQEVTGLAVGTSPTAWATTVSFHTGVATGVTTCQECHGLKNGSTVAGTSNSIPAGITVSATKSAVGNSGTTITPYYTPPASGQPIYDSMSHTDANVAGVECTTCHATPAANAGSAYSIWRAGKFHANVPSVNTATGKCVNCHANIMPNASFTAFNHTTLLSATGPVTSPMGNLTSDCATCHTTNVGVNWLGATGFSHTPTPATCISCHASKFPTGTVPNTVDGFTHAAGFGTECATCHTTVTGNIGVKWSGGFFNHNNNNAGSFTNCSPCHDTRHHHAGQNCTGCHTITWPKPSSNGVYGGSFNGG